MARRLRQGLAAAAIGLAFVALAAALMPRPTGPVWLLGMTAAAGIVVKLGGLRELWALPFLLLLHKPLENENRQRILAFLDANPGASIQDIRRHLDVAWGTVVYHLDRLRREQQVVSHRHGNHHRYWRSNTPQARMRHGWSVLEQSTARDIAMAVATTPGMHQQEICQRLSVQAPNASKHLSRLERHGLVAKRRISRYAVYEPTPHLHEVLRLRGVPMEASLEGLQEASGGEADVSEPQAAP